MGLLSSKNGFRGEYLAKYIISRFAFISESRVGEDFGIDFYCGLNKETTENGIDSIHYDKPFLLQIKTKTKSDEHYSSTYSKPNVIYETNHEIKTLFSLEIPFFIGFLDLPEQQLDIHSTCSMWYLQMLNDLESCSKVTLRFRNREEHQNISLPIPITIENKKQWSVDLGHPLVSLKLTELETDNVKIENIRRILSETLDKEFENIVSKRLGLSYFRWVYEYETNNFESLKYGYKFVNIADDSSFDKDPQAMIDVIHPYLISLALTLKNKQRFDVYDNVREILKLVSSNKRFNDIEEKFSEIYQEMEYEKLNYIPIATSGLTYTTLITQQRIVSSFEVKSKTKHYVPQKLGKPRSRKL